MYAVHPNPERLESIQQMTSPDSPQALREFLGIPAIYRGTLYQRPGTPCDTTTRTSQEGYLLSVVPTYEKIFNNVKDRICAQSLCHRPLCHITIQRRRKLFK